MSHYTHGQDPAVLAAHRSRTAQNSATHLLPRLAPGLRLLDVGCGQGTITRGLADAVAPGLVTGIDTSAEVLEVATQLAPMPPNLTFQVGDVYQLDFPSQHFDVVHAHNLVQHLPEVPKALREMARVTKSGGLISLREGDYAGAFWYPACAGWEGWQAAYQQVARCGGGELAAGRRLRAWALEAGLVQLESSASLMTYPGVAPAQQWAGSWATRIRQTNFHRLAQECQVATAEQLEAMAADITAWAAQPGAFFAMPLGQLLITVP